MVHVECRATKRMSQNWLDLPEKKIINYSNELTPTSSSSSVGATARCGPWPVEQYLSI